MRYSKTILPPILRYTYPSFKYENNDQTGVDVSLDASFSVVNNISEVDHIQVRIMSLNSDRNGLNPNIFPRGIMFVKPVAGPNGFKINFNTVIDGKNIFSIGEEGAYASFYRIQVRLVEDGTRNYLNSYKQAPTEEWIDANMDVTSEWSNSSIFKTVKEPNFLLRGFDKDKVNILKRPDILINGHYSTVDKAESLEKYSIELFARGELIESSGDIYVKEHEKVSIMYRMQEVFENEIEYTFKLNIMSETGYEDSISYKVQFELSFVKIFDTITVKENEDTASTEIEIQGFQARLEHIGRRSQSNWLADKFYNRETDESGFTHFMIDNGVLKSEEQINISYDTFMFGLSIAKAGESVFNSFREALAENKPVFSFSGDSGVVKYKVFFYKKNGITIALLKEDRAGMSGRRVDYYKVPLKNDVDTHETVILIGKKRGDTIFEAATLHRNEFN